MCSSVKLLTHQCYRLICQKKQRKKYNNNQPHNNNTILFFAHVSQCHHRCNTQFNCIITSWLSQSKLFHFTPVYNSLTFLMHIIFIVHRYMFYSILQVLKLILLTRTHGDDHYSCCQTMFLESWQIHHSRVTPHMMMLAVAEPYLKKSSLKLCALQILSRMVLTLTKIDKVRFIVENSAAATIDSRR